MSKQPKRPARRSRWKKWERKMAGTYVKGQAQTPPNKQDDFDGALFGQTKNACRDLDRSFRRLLAE